MGRDAVDPRDRAEGSRGDACALGGGLLFGAGLFLSYGLVLLAVIPVGSRSRAAV